MSITFTKMHGLGNDFMVIDAIHQKVNLSKTDIMTLANRHKGVGFDQCLLIESSQKKNIDFFYRIFNANGQEVGQCGNGARCLARFINHYGLSKKRSLTVATHTTIMKLQLNSDDSVTIDMGKPKRHPRDIPIETSQETEYYALPLNNQSNCLVHAISVGNPHAVMVVPDVKNAPVGSLGKQISEHPLFPLQTNAGFMEILSPIHVRFRVYERGCGETEACGSGAVAAVAIGRLYHQLDKHVTVSVQGGDLSVTWEKLDESIFLTGPATFVYEGRLI